MVILGVDPGDSTAVWPMTADGSVALGGPSVIRRGTRDSVRDFGVSFARRFTSGLEGKWPGAGKMVLAVEQFTTPPNLVHACRLALVHGAVYAAAVCHDLPVHVVPARRVTRWMGLPEGLPRERRKAELARAAATRFPAAVAVIQGRPREERPHLLDSFLIAEYWRTHKEESHEQS